MKKCPEGKELNKKTNRCRKVCKENEIRNIRGKCVKNRNKERALVPFKGVSQRVSQKALVPFKEVSQKALVPFKGVSQKALVPFKGVSQKALVPFKGVSQKALVPFKGVSIKKQTLNFDDPFDKFKDQVKQKFSNFKPENKPLQNECIENEPDKNKKRRGSSKLILRPHQEFVSAYFKPETPIKGVLLYYSIGSGKTAAAVNVASQFEKEGYSILWVTRRTLVKDIEKNLFEKSAHSIINEAVEKKLIKDTIEAKKSFFSRKLNWFGIVSYKTFSNLCKGNKTELYKILENKNGKDDIFKKTLIIIDEVHKLFDKEGLSKAEMPQTNYIREAIDKSYKVSGDNSLRLLLMSGTPVAKGFDILNLLKDKNKIKKEDPEDIVKEKLKGIVFYFDMSKNPNFFAQTKFNDVDTFISSLPIELVKKQDYVKENCNKSKKVLEEEREEKIDKDQYKTIKEECKKIKNEIKEIKKIPYQENVIYKKCGVDLDTI